MNFFDQIRTVTPATKAFLESLAAGLLPQREGWPLEEAVIMMAALTEGPDVDRIAQLTGYPSDFVNRIGSRLIDSGLWKDGRTDYQEWDPKTKEGFISFLTDYMVALGQARRTAEKQNGEWVYKSLIYRPSPVN